MEINDFQSVLVIARWPITPGHSAISTAYSQRTGARAPHMLYITIDERECNFRNIIVSQFQRLKLGIREMIQRMHFRVENSGFAPGLRGSGLFLR
jgi:hypothetical protein